MLTKNIVPGDITIAKAKGIKLWDKTGKEYLDFSSQTLNLNLGNSPDIAKEAFLKQFDKFTFLSSRFKNEVFVNLARELINIAPAELKKVNLKLTNGSDANESAFKRVRVYRGKPYIISFYRSHLGESSETLSARGKNFYRKQFRGSNNFIHLPPPFILQTLGHSLKESEKITLEQLEILLRERDDIAALIIEPVMVNAGGYIFTKNFLQSVRSICSERNISLIFDEIQTAFGWMGTFFAAKYFRVTPDLLTLGKGLASGFPLAAVLMKDEYDLMEYGEDEYTYGGHPVSCAIAIENIKILKKTNILKDVVKKSRILEGYLRQLQDSFPKLIKEVRICGLIAAIEFKEPKTMSIASVVYTESLKRGLILRKSLDGRGSSLVLKPPLIVSDVDIDDAFKILSKSLDYINKKIGRL